MAFSTLEVASLGGEPYLVPLDAVRTTTLPSETNSVLAEDPLGMVGVNPSTLKRYLLMQHMSSSSKSDSAANLESIHVPIACCKIFADETEISSSDHLLIRAETQLQCSFTRHVIGEFGSPRYTLNNVKDGMAELQWWQQLITEAPYLCPCFDLLGLDMSTGIKMARLRDPQDPRGARPKSLPASCRGLARVLEEWPKRKVHVSEDMHFHADWSCGGDDFFEESHALRLVRDEDMADDGDLVLDMTRLVNFTSFENIPCSREGEEPEGDMCEGLVIDNPSIFFAPCGVVRFEESKAKLDEVDPSVGQYLARVVWILIPIGLLDAGLQKVITPIFYPCPKGGWTNGTTGPSNAEKQDVVLLETS